MAPTLTNALKPTWAPRAQSRIEVQMAPLWLSRAMLPVRAMVEAKLALRLPGGWMTPTPKGYSRRLRIRMRPTLRGVALAPMTAIEAGWKNGSSEWVRIGMVWLTGVARPADVVNRGRTRARGRGR